MKGPEGTVRLEAVGVRNWEKTLARPVASACRSGQDRSILNTISDGEVLSLTKGRLAPLLSHE